MHIVDVRHRSADLSASMAQMRTWLDHHRIEPRLFELAFLPSRAIRFRLAFRHVDQAASFAVVFQSEASAGSADAGSLAA